MDREQKNAAARRGGRARIVTVQEIVRVGRELGMRRLSVKAVATGLGVSTAALYRHVEGRWELERLVGESLLAELALPDDPTEDTERHLLSFALRLRAFALARPGLARYFQVLFPRGEHGRRLLTAEVDALERRGYAPEVAVVLAGSVATLTISLAASEENDTEARSGDGFARERDSAVESLLADTRLGPAHLGLPQVSTEDYVRLLLAASIRGLVSAAPPGRPVNEIVADLSAYEGRW
ncbi:TetR/AcrR family transcriptional regulator [Actinocorallia sp. API 0066]|uniref:TetR/AcrR family transcriptional regulator n=1 Tax=Actinocorallia sp. API 0066 TaxID=2896846 RepID=UPI001E5E2595|nr:TetR/AcrR family transcriptional regulator [Actinocorallia sp. API 0066]MCD0453203.1 TetR/AcrR family transcriptional regulator [Actinocorallia sp. API 0066]